jgi:hypothetical protein
VHYRKFNIASSPSQTGEQLCRAALDTLDTAGVSLWLRAQDRLMVLGSESRQLVVNRVADLKDAVFGEMCLLQQGGYQALLELHASKVKTSTLTLAEIFSLQENAAPAGSQYVRGMAYWLAIGHHLFFVRMQTMGAEYIGQYLDWLLRVKTTVVPAGAQLSLQAEFDKAQLAGDIGDIKSFRVSGIAKRNVVVIPETAGGQTKTLSTARQVGRRVAEFAQAVPIVEALLGKKKATSLVKSLGPREYLAVDAAVKVKGTRTMESRAKVAQLAGELGDITDGKVQVEGKDGRWSDDDVILRTRMPFEPLQDDSNLLDFDNVADQLREVYSRFVQDGKIAAQ